MTKKNLVFDNSTLTKSRVSILFKLGFLFSFKGSTFIDENSVFSFYDLQDCYLESCHQFNMNTVIQYHESSTKEKNKKFQISAQKFEKYWINNVMFDTYLNKE